MSGRDFKTEPVEIELGGQKRSLYYDLNAMVELEEQYGELSAMMADVTVKKLRFMLWAGLLWNNRDQNGKPTLLEETVGSWLTMADVPRLMESVTKAILDAMPKSDPKNG